MEIFTIFVPQKTDINLKSVKTPPNIYDLKAPKREIEVVALFEYNVLNNNYARAMQANEELEKEVRYWSREVDKFSSLKYCLRHIYYLIKRNLKGGTND